MNTQRTLNDEKLRLLCKNAGLDPLIEKVMNVQPSFWVRRTPFVELRANWSLSRLVDLQRRLQQMNSKLPREFHRTIPVMFTGNQKADLHRMVCRDVVLGVKWPLLCVGNHGEAVRMRYEPDGWVGSIVYEKALVELVDSLKSTYP